MKSFLILLNDRQPNLLNPNLLKTHIEYLKQLRIKEHLTICGPFSDNNGAVLIIKAISKEQTEKLIQEDPFVKEKYYKKYIIREFIEANDDNHWLQDSSEGSTLPISL